MVRIVVLSCSLMKQIDGQLIDLKFSAFRAAILGLVRLLAEDPVLFTSTNKDARSSKAIASVMSRGAVGIVVRILEYVMCLTGK